MLAVLIYRERARKNSFGNFSAGYAERVTKRARTERKIAVNVLRLVSHGAALGSIVNE